MTVKALKKQLAAAIAMVVVSGVALSSSTYAWFANNNKVTATGMTVNATADASLVIKGSAETVFTSVGTNALNNTTLKPSTSYDGKNFGYLGSDVKVLNPGDEKATWSGESGGFKDGDLVKATSAGTYYATTTYSIKSLNEAANVYVDSIELGGTAVDIDKALRVSVTIGSTTYVYNAGGGTNGEGVGKFESDAWSLATASYTNVNDNTKTFALSADTPVDVVVNIWYEGQDEKCFTDNVKTNNKSITIGFTKKTS